MRKSTWIAIGIILWASLLAGQTIRITSPAIGADWCRGQSYTITWTSTGAVGASVRIRLMQGAAAIQEITLNTRNSGTFAWPILASTPEGNYTVRVRSLESATMSDSAAFQISSCVTPTPPPASGFPMTLTSPAADETSRDIVLNPVDQLHLPTALVSDPKCESCLEFDLGKIKAALGDPSQPLTMTLYHAGQKVAELGTIGGGKTPPDQVSAAVSPDVYKALFTTPQDYAITLKTQAGKEIAKIPTEVILQK